MKTATCEVRYDGYDWRNILTVTSPTGKTKRLHCNGKWDLMSPALVGLIKEAQRLGWSQPVKIEISYEVLREIVDLEGD